MALALPILSTYTPMYKLHPIAFPHTLQKPMEFDYDKPHDKEITTQLRSIQVIGANIL